MVPPLDVHQTQDAMDVSVLQSIKDQALEKRI